MAHISWSHNILFQVLETDPHHPALPLFTVVNIVKISRNYFENTVNIISNIEPGQKVNINGSKIQNQCVIMCDCMTCVIVFDIHKYQISPKDWIQRLFSPISHKIYTTYLRGFKTSFNKVTRINSESAFTFILSSLPWMSGAGCWDILMRCLFTWCLPSSRWRKRILSDSETRKMCRRTWTCQWPEIQNYTKHVSDVRWGYI